MIDLSGQVIRGYALRELVATGGFAAVYRAIQTAVNRDVAIKVILPKYANDPDFVRRFETEAQVIARLDHLHIVPLYDYWREPNNAFLVMRWLRGGSLYRSLKQQGTWPLPAVARLLDQVGAALTVAHRRGVIHQDLTPANILLDEEHNAYLADFGIARDLIQAGNEPSSGDKRLYGSPAYIAPERLRYEPVLPQTDIYSLGIILYETLTGRPPFEGGSYTTLVSKHLNEAPPPLNLYRADLPEAVNQIIHRATEKDPLDRYPGALDVAIEFREAVGLVETTAAPGSPTVAVEPEAPPGTMPLVENTVVLVKKALQPLNPYKGLQAFDEADAGDFFGRTMFVQQLINRLNEPSDYRRFLAVIGPSGSGKSSVVKAGLLPALRRGSLPGSERWFIAKMVPGEHPFGELEAALLAVSFGETTPNLERLRQDERGLADTLEHILPDAQTDLLLVIDQFEEVFTLVKDETERDLFLRSLLEAVTRTGARLWAVITLRADFYDRPLNYAGFGPLMRERTEVVLPLSGKELQEAIFGPAQRFSLILEGQLVDQVIADVSTRPGTLPLLQYALTELFNRRENFNLTLQGYRASGGVLGALARRAEELYSDMETDQQAATRQLLLRLVNAGSEDTRRRVRWSEVVSLVGANWDAMQAVLDTFGRYRLITFDRDPQTREPTIEIAHEALIRTWDRLRAWLDESREDMLVQRRLALTADEWITANRNTSYLAEGVRLGQFEDLSLKKSIALTHTEQEYLKASVQQRQTRLRVRRAVLTALILLTVFASGLAVFALDRQNSANKARRQAEESEQVALTERDRADEQAGISRSRELSITAITRLDEIDLALLLSLSALDAADTPDARSSLLTALESAPYLVTLLHDHAAPVRAVAYAPDGVHLAAGAADGLIIVWDTTSSPPTAQQSWYAAGRVNTLAFSPDGSTLAAGGENGLIARWNVASGEPVGDPLVGHTNAVWSLTFSPDGTRLASAGADTTVRMWDAQTGDPIGDPLTGHTDMVYSVAFNPNGAILASASADGTIRLWDAATGAPVGDPLVGHSDWVWSVVFSPDGNTLASGSADRTIRLWNMAGQPLGAPLMGHTDAVRSLAFSPDGQTLVSGSLDHTLRVWSLADGTAITLAQHRDDVWGVSFSANGHSIASGGRDNRVILWDWQQPSPLRQDIGQHSEAVLSVALSPDGLWLASAGGRQDGFGQDNAIRLWDAATHQQRGLLAGHPNTVTALAFSPDSRTLVSASADRSLIVWDIQTGQPRYDPLAGHDSAILALVYDPAGQHVYSGGDDGQILEWDMTVTPAISQPFAQRLGSVTALSISPDGLTLIAGLRDGSIAAWNVTTRRPLGEPLAGQNDVITSLAYQHGGSLLASASRDGTIMMWDTAARQPVRAPLAGHTNWVMSVAFSPDGSLLASGSRDGTIILWDVATGRPLGQPITGSVEWITSVAFAPDSQTLAAGSSAGEVAVWSVSVESWKVLACRVAHRNLNPTEQERYFGALPYKPVCPAGSW
jgi:WD40 repeat protein/tRNA A-37 threonylcarbamoyl transferase component Bud32/ABC-type branched-subunit amino acid transport system ATPase component